MEIKRSLYSVFPNRRIWNLTLRISGGSQESMDVDMDVADWLDSLLPSNSNANRYHGLWLLFTIRVAPDTELGRYPANFFAGYPAEQLH